MTPEAASETGAELVHCLFVLLKAAGVYGRSNEGYRKRAEETRAALSRALDGRRAARLEARGDALFLDGERVRFPLEASAAGDFLRRELARLGAGGLEFRGARAAAQLDDFAFALRAGERGGAETLEQSSRRLRGAGVDAIALLPGAADDEELAAAAAAAAAAKGSGKAAGNGAADAAAAAAAKEAADRSAARTAFFRAVAIVEEVMKTARAGRAFSFDPARAAVGVLVERVVEDEQSLFALALLRTFDEYTYAHCVNVSVYSVAIGTRLGLRRELLDELGFAGLFHDLGKSRLPLALIDKPDEYDAADWAQMRRHPALGAKLLLAQERPFDRALARAVSTAFEHHLALDGAGYPRPRRPRRQELFSRICAIADSFDALTSGRVYTRRALGPAEALARLVQRSGTGYDPLLLRLFVDAVGPLPVGTPLTLDDGRVGVVRRGGREDRLRPEVVIPSAGGAQRADLSRRDPATGKPLLSAVGIASAAELGRDVASLLNETEPGGSA